MSDQELQTRDDISNKVVNWRSKITEAWSKSIESIVEVATLLKKAEEDIANTEEYDNLIKDLPFSASVASNLRTIANNPILTESKNFGKLPGYINTLYYLAFIPEEQLLDLITNEKVNAYTKLAEAKALARKHGWTPDKSLSQAPRFEDMVEVGLIAIPKEKNISDFIEALDRFLVDHQAASRYTHKEGSLAERYRETIKNKAEEKIKETQGQLGKYTVDQVRMIDKATSYLSVRENPKEALSIKGDKIKEVGLPKNDENYAALRELLGSDVTNENIRKWCKETKVPCQLMVKTLDKEVYVWELLRTYATDENGYKVLKMIEKINEDEKISEEVRRAAAEALAIARKFENPRKPRTQSASGKKTS